jgi:prolyl-tRNA synthetase
MQNIGAQEVLMLMTQPAELWQKTDRFNDYGLSYYAAFKDRHDCDFCL